MAKLTTENRQQIWRGLMRYWSTDRHSCTIIKADLQAAVNATDDWIDDNQFLIDATLPAAARGGLTETQKMLLFCAVALLRVDTDTASLLRRVIGEVD